MPTRLSRALRRWAPVRWLREHPLAADTLLALAVTVAMLLSVPGDESLAADGYRPADATTYVLLALGVLPLALRRRYPSAVMAVVTVATVVGLTGDHVTNGVGPIIALYTVAAHCSRRVSLGWLAAVGAVIVYVQLALPDALAGDLIGNAITFVAAWALGDSMQTRRQHVAELEARAERAERDREDRARRAVTDERTRIARELHDVVAHHVSVMTVQAGAARKLMGQDPERAGHAIANVEATGREALVEMRRLLGVLRTTDDPGALREPQPCAAEIERLADQVSEAGLPVSVTVEGAASPLPSGLDLSVYRIVQEALTNALKHAGPARAEVHLRYTPESVEVEVLDDGRGAAASAPDPRSGGHGLVGMRERVALFGGELEAGPRPGGGYAVTAHLPVAEAAE